MPDFQEFYGLGLVGAARTMHPVELVLLIDGLPERSRFHARQLGERYGGGWSRADWLAFDTRNAIEGLRASVASALSKKGSDFREWPGYPGEAAERDRKRRAAFDRAWSQATKAKE